MSWETFWSTLQLKVFEKSHYKKFSPIKQTLDSKHVSRLRFSSLLHYFQYSADCCTETSHQLGSTQILSDPFSYLFPVQTGRRRKSHFYASLLRLKQVTLSSAVIKQTEMKNRKCTSFGHSSNLHRVSPTALTHSTWFDLNTGDILKSLSGKLNRDSYNPVKNFPHQPIKANGPECVMKKDYSAPWDLWCIRWFWEEAAGGHDGSTQEETNKKMHFQMNLFWCAAENLDTDRKIITLMSEARVMRP